MARIIGGIGTSHVPTIGMAFDRKKRDDPDWAPLFAGYEPAAKWLAERSPYVLVFFYNDISHVGLYAGNGRVIHAPRPGKSVEYIKMSYMSYAGARRPG